MLFEYTRVIRVQDTDATGVIYFTNQLQIGLEAFEEYLRSEEFSFTEMVHHGDYLLPIVHAEADFCAPIRIGEELKVHLEAERIGTSSFTMKTTLYNGEELAGIVCIVHVALSKETNKSIDIPFDILNLINK